MPRESRLPLTMVGAGGRGCLAAITASPTLARRLADLGLTPGVPLEVVLLYVPCAATVAAQAQEFGWRWAALAIVVQLLIPWLLATLIYQGGRLIGLH